MIPGYKVSKSCFFPKSSNIVHHRKHSYDEKKNVIVVPDMDEDRQEFINSFKETVGLKNILKQLQLTGQGVPSSLMYNEEQDAVDLSGMPDNINDLKRAADEGDQVIRDAVSKFNELYGTTYSVEDFIKKSSDGSLMTEVTELLKAREAGKTEPKKEGVD